MHSARYAFVAWFEYSTGTRRMIMVRPLELSRRDARVGRVIDVYEHGAALHSQF